MTEYTSPEKDPHKRRRKLQSEIDERIKTRVQTPRELEILVDQLVWREVELEKLDPKVHIVRIAARVGEKKRRGILARAKDLNFHIANPGKEEGRAVTETPAVEEEKGLPVETGEEKVEEKAEIAEDEDVSKTEESSE